MCPSRRTSSVCLCVSVSQSQSYSSLWMWGHKIKTHHIHTHTVKERREKEGATHTLAGGVWGKDDGGPYLYNDDYDDTHSLIFTITTRKPSTTGTSTATGTWSSILVVASGISTHHIHVTWYIVTALCVGTRPRPATTTTTAQSRSYWEWDSRCFRSCPRWYCRR